MWFSVFLGLQISEIQEKLSDVVNNLVKHFCKPEKEVCQVIYQLISLVVIILILFCKCHSSATDILVRYVY